MGSGESHMPNNSASQLPGMPSFNLGGIQHYKKSNLRNNSSNTNEPLQMSPAHQQSEFKPNPTDDKQVLQQKYELNKNAAWGEMGMDFVMPNRESQVTDFQANMLTAKEYMKNK